MFAVAYEIPLTYYVSGVFGSWYHFYIGVVGNGILPIIDFSPKIPNVCNEPNPRCSIFQFLSQNFNWKLPDKLFCLKEEPQWTCLLVPGIIVMQSFSTLRVPPIT